VSFVSRSGRICALAVWATIVGQAVVSCSSNSARPAELGDCVKTTDAACPTPDPGGGGGGGPGGLHDSGASDGGAVEDTASGCGTAQALLASQNTSCVPCVEGTSGTGNGCCGADATCSAQPACLNLLQCMVGCSLTDATCANTCENNNPNGVQAYNDFAACLSLNCSPACATLPQGGTTDF
jgi:hypothetical protein